MNSWIKSDCNNCMTCGFRSPMFNYLSESELELVNKNKFEVHFRSGEIIRKQGTFLSHVISLNSGIAKLYIEGPKNRNLILRLIKPTNFIGGPGMYFDQRHHYSMYALTDCSACFIDVETFKKIIHSNADFANAFMKEFSRNMLSTFDRLINHTQKQIPGRMANTLLYLANDIFESMEFKMIISTNDLAELTGMSRDSAVKVLREFKDDGIISIVSGHLTLHKPQSLIKISDFG